MTFERSEKQSPAIASNDSHQALHDDVFGKPPASEELKHNNHHHRDNPYINPPNETHEKPWTKLSVSPPGKVVSA